VCVCVYIYIEYKNNICDKTFHTANTYRTVSLLYSCVANSTMPNTSLKNMFKVNKRLIVSAHNVTTAMKHTTGTVKRCHKINTMKKNDFPSYVSRSTIVLYAGIFIYIRTMFIM